MVIVAFHAIAKQVEVTTFSCIHGILLGDEKAQTRDIHNKLDESPENTVEKS